MFGNQVLDTIFGPWATNTLYCANRLSIFNHLAEKSLTVEELAEAVKAVPHYLKAVLDACTAMGFLHFEDNRYTNSNLSNIYFVEEKPLFLGDITDVLAVEAANWENLYDLVKSGENRTVVSKSALELEPQRFTMAMNNLAMLGEADALVNAVNLTDCKKLTDVGCGSGIYSISLCRRYPDLNAVLLDRKEVLETTRKLVAKNNLEYRIKTREADIVNDSYGEPSDVVLLSDVLYGSQSACMTILQSAYENLVPGGTLLIRGYYSDPGGKNPVFGSLFNIKLLLDDSGREIISVSRLRKWLEEIGFKDDNAFPLTEKSTCITAVKAK